MDFFNSMAEKHIAKQLSSCCRFIIDKRHLFEATVFVFFILPICAFRKWKKARTWVENILFSGQKNLRSNYFGAKPTV